MEKLQQALSIARSKRPERMPTTAHGVHRPAVIADLDERWAELQSIELDDKQLKRSRIVSASAGQAATPFDILRTKVLLTMRKNEWKRLAITSPTANCGKTTTACNLGLGFSRQRDVRTILFDFDLRRPSIAKALGLTPAKDISEMLAGDVHFKDQALRFRENVAISCANAPVPDPTSVLLNQVTHGELAEMELQYRPDVMIFDLPPLLDSDDTRAFLREADCALMITKSGKSTVAQVDACEREIADHTNVLGVVLNQNRDADAGGYVYET